MPGEWFWSYTCYFFHVEASQVFLHHPLPIEWLIYTMKQFGSSKISPVDKGKDTIWEVTIFGLQIKPNIKLYSGLNCEPICCLFQCFFIYIFVFWLIILKWRYPHVRFSKSSLVWSSLTMKLFSFDTQRLSRVGYHLKSEDIQFANKT